VRGNSPPHGVGNKLYRPHKVWNFCGFHRSREVFRRRRASRRRGVADGRKLNLILTFSGEIEVPLINFEGCADSNDVAARLLCAAVLRLRSCRAGSAFGRTDLGRIGRHDARKEKSP
jgi:hypothetical protein